METLIKIDRTKSPLAQRNVIMNRWHPDIPIAAYANPNEPFRIECMDWTGGQIRNDDSANDVRDVNLNPCHHLSGPIGIRGAMPGDLLEVDILDIGCFEDNTWGYTGIWRKDKAWGFLDDYFDKTAKCIWDFNGIWATTRHIPNLRFAGVTHPGIIGCLPSHELLAEWDKRELALIKAHPDAETPRAMPPEPDGVILGSMSGAKLAEAGKIAARTIPPRENGGNCDIKNLCRGSKVYLPVYVKDAGLAVGDLHFSQGDGEITFCGAIEMPGWIKLNVKIIKDGCRKYGVKQSMFRPGPVDPNYSEFMVFEGISVEEETGIQRYLDVTLAYKRACRNAIHYLSKFGYTGEQIYTIISCAPVEGHISSVVDIPNACVSLQIPTAMFDFDITPNANGPTKKVEKSNLAFES